MERKLYILSWMLVSALLLPLFQNLTDIPHARKLKGIIRKAELPEFSFKEYFSGEYQPKVEKAFNDRIGYRRSFVRVNNQIAFTFYRRPFAGGVVIGKKNYLYEINYIKAYNGTNFLGDSVIREKVRKLKVIQDSLNSRGKQLLVSFSAGKGTFYPEYFPDRYKTKVGPSNHETYIKYCKDFGVNTLDFNTWFAEMKDTSRYCLYTKSGIHWSFYGMVLAADTLIKRVEVLMDKDLPTFDWSEIEEREKYGYTDMDIELGLNIIFPLKRHTNMAYPKIKYPEGGGSDSVRSIIISDSFYWGLFNMGISNRVFHEGEYWYYNRVIHAYHIEGETLKADIDVEKRFEESDIIILMATESQLVKFPWGFVEEAYTIISE